MDRIPANATQAPLKHDEIATSMMSKMPRVIARALVVYPGAVMSSQVKGGASYRDAYQHMLKKIRHIPNVRSGSGAYVGASTASLVPAALTDSIQAALMKANVPEKHAEHAAVATSAVGTALATNLRNFAFTSGEHGLDKTKIFKPLPVGASFVRDMVSGVVYSKALQGSGMHGTTGKVRTAVQYGGIAGVLTSLPDAYAYMAATKGAVSMNEVLKRSLLTAPIRGVNVAVSAGILAWNRPTPRV